MNLRSMKKYKVIVEEENMLGTEQDAPIGGFVPLIVETENPEEAGQIAIAMISKQNQERFGDMHDPNNAPKYKVANIEEINIS